FYVQENEEKIATTDQIFEVKKQYPNAVITSFTPSFEANRTAVVEMKDYGENVSVYVNPYNGEIIGTLYEKDRFMAFVNDMHNGELWGGTFGNRLVEDRKSTRLNSSHVKISYAVFCLKKKNNHYHLDSPEDAIYRLLSSTL